MRHHVAATLIGAVTLLSAAAGASEEKPGNPAPTPPNPWTRPPTLAEQPESI